MALNVTSCFRRKNGHDGTTMTVEFYSPRVLKGEREREKKRNFKTFKKITFLLFFFVFFLLLINISKIVVLYFFENIGNFIDSCFEPKIAFFSNSIIRKKRISI